MEAPPLEKMVALVVGLEQGQSEAWQFTDQSLSLVGCSKKSFYRALNNLHNKGILRKTTHGKYANRVPKRTVPVNFKYHQRVLGLKLTYKEKLLLLAITSFINKTKDYCWVGEAKVKALASLTDKTYKKTLESLEIKGLVCRINVQGKWVFRSPYQSVKMAPVCVKNDPQIVILEKISVIMAEMKEQENACMTSIPTVSKDGSGSEHKGLKYKKINNIAKQAIAGANMIHKVGSASEIIAKVKAKNLSAMKGKPGQQLSKIWKSNLATVCELENMSETHITQKQQGQLNMLAKNWGEHANKRLLDTMTDWESVRHYIADATGLKKSPEKPHIGFILANQVYVTMYWHEHECKAPKTALQPGIKESTNKPTWESLQKLWAEEDD